MTTEYSDLVTLYADLASIQDGVNVSLAGADWAIRAEEFIVQGTANDGRVPLDYSTAGLDEAMELFRSAVPFKWWAKGDTVDRDNSLVELVDILHFGLSHQIAICLGNQGKVDYPTVARAVLLGADYSKDGTALNLYGKGGTALGSEGTTQSDLLELRRHVKSLIAGLALGRYNWFHFWSLVRLLGSSPVEVAGLYRAKAVLNKFRKQNGYKEGTYIKMWKLPDYPEAVEDNKALMDYVAAVSEVTGTAPDDGMILSWLSDTYVTHVR